MKKIYDKLKTPNLYKIIDYNNRHIINENIEKFIEYGIKYEKKIVMNPVRHFVIN